jgi:hypothetical protein
MLPAVLSPTSATLPAARTAAVMGSGDVSTACGSATCGGLGRGVAGAFRLAAGRRFGAALDRGLGFAPAGAAPDAAATRTAPVRFSLRWPGLDLGRLPSTPGCSVSSAATREK